jgi:FtsX-like permease family
MSSGGGLVKIAGIDKGVVRELIDFDVDEKVWQEFKSRKNAALLGVDIAEDRQLRQRYVWEPGREFVLADMGDLSLYFAGTFTPRDPTLRTVILTGDVFLQEADDRRGKTNQFLVRITHRDEAQRVAKAIDALDFPVAVHTETQQASLDQAFRDLDEMLSYAGHVIIAVGIVIFLGLANATSMAVRERMREVGMLRALGFSRRRVVMLVAGEALFLSLLGGVIGCLAAWGTVYAVAPPMRVGGFAFPVVLSLLLAGTGAVAAAAVGLLGGLFPGVRVSRRPIVEALRSVD